MPFNTTKNTRKQVGRNANAIQAINDRDNPAFRRISSNPIIAPIRNRIFQVRSWAAPFIDKFDDTFDRPGVYNCVEMIMNNNLFEDYVTGSQSPLISNTPNRITDKAESVDEDYKSNASFAAGDDYDDWESSTSYQKGDVVRVITEYTESVSSLLRKVSTMYQATESNTNKEPASNPDTWTSLTVEVFNLPEQYVGNGQAPKLGRYDVISGVSKIDNTGISRWVGVDTMGSSKAFHLDSDATASTTPIGNLAYGGYTSDPGSATAVEGELGYNITLSVVDFSSMRWDLVTQSLSLTGSWINGLWWLNQISAQISTGFFGLDYVSDQMRVLVDGTTIGFNGSGELEVI